MQSKIRKKYKANIFLVFYFVIPTKEESGLEKKVFLEVHPAPSFVGMTNWGGKQTYKA
jgi:hypothetical protein